MKKTVLTLLFIIAALSGYCTTWTIKNSGFSFDPATITIKQGDDVNFELASIHNAIEVSQSTWNANGNTPIIGFSVSFGGGNVPASELTVGTHYYVCEPHASGGMKGRIIVQSTSGVVPVKTDPSVTFSSNPVSSSLKIQLNQTGNLETEITLFNIQGKQVGILLKKSLISGYFSHTFDLTGLFPSGIYFVQIVTSEKRYVKKIVIL